jgi:hypothetical protein
LARVRGDKVADYDAQENFSRDALSGVSERNNHFKFFLKMTNLHRTAQRHRENTSALRPFTIWCTARAKRHR